VVAGQGDIPSDKELLARAREDPESFGTFYDRHVQAVLAFCVRRTGCAETATDITAEVFAAAYARRRSYRATSAPAEAWLFGIARRQIGTFLRKRRVSDRYRRRFGFHALEVAPDESERIVQMIVLEPLRTALVAALDELPAPQAHALRLRFVDELPYVEVAARLGCSEGAARVRVSRGLTKLAGMLEAP
jgi:RNA polymerase sigma-70 factor (ECF subfamily)